MMARPKGTGTYKEGAIQEPVYVQSHPEMLLKLMQDGQLDCQIAKYFKVSERTIQRWKRDHEDFAHAYEIGAAACESYWIEWGKEQKKGLNFNYWIGIMNNKFKWATKPSDGSTTNININNMNILQEKSKSDLIEYINTVANKNKDVLDVKFITRIESSEPDQSE